MAGLLGDYSTADINKRMAKEQLYQDELKAQESATAPSTYGVPGWLQALMKKYGLLGMLGGGAAAGSARSDGHGLLGDTP